MQTKADLMFLDFSENESLLLLELLKNAEFSKDDIVNNNLIFDLSQYEFCEITISLKNVFINAEIPTDSVVLLNKARIDKTENGYSLTGEANYYDFENDKNVVLQLCIEFESVEIRNKSLKSTFNVLEGQNPWDSLSYYASCIYEKVKRSYLTANEKEKELEPLLKEFYILNHRDTAFNNIRFDALKNYLPENSKLNKLFANIEKSKNSGKRSSEINRLFKHMSCNEFESSWHNLLNLLNRSQAYYEEEKNPEISSSLMNEHRQIDKIMHDNGYKGSYPFFEKITKIKGIHLTKNNGELFFAGMEKAIIFVECKDNIYDNYGNIEFQISTVLGNPDKVRDKYSCFFAKAGKGYYRAEYIMYETDESGELHFFDKDEQIPYIVCKTAELKKLSKEEKEICGSAKTKEEIIFKIFIWMIGGIFFGICMTLGFILFEFLVTLSTGLISDFPQLFSETPWWMIFLFAWLAFGCTMSVLSIISD